MGVGTPAAWPICHHLNHESQPSAETARKQGPPRGTTSCRRLQMCEETLRFSKPNAVSDHAVC